MSAVPISAGGNTEPGVCTQACRFNGLSLLVVIHASLLKHELELGRSRDLWSDTLQ